MGEVPRDGQTIQIRVDGEEYHATYDSVSNTFQRIDNKAIVQPEQVEDWSPVT